MAITNNGTKNSLPAAQVPDDYTRPTVTEFTDHQLVYDVVFSVLKATVDETDPATTMAAIIADATIGITKQVDDYIAAVFIATRTVTVWVDWRTFQTNLTPILKDDVLLTDAVANYECTVKIYIKSL